MSVKMKMKKKWFIHSMEYYIAMRMNKLQLPHKHSTGQKKLEERLVLYWIIPFTQNSKPNEINLGLV